MNRQKIIDDILQFIGQESPELVGEIEPDSDLFELKVMDSFRILTLVLHIEDKIGLILSHEDLTEENFRSLDSIANLALRYMESDK